MRPDKKKTRHHDSRKAAARAKAKEEAKGGKAKTDEGKEEEEVLDEVEDDEDEGYGRRNLTSNWAKYETMPEEDGDGDEMTGEDFNYLLQNASTSSSLFRLKSELEWDSDASLSAMVSNELFALDLRDAEAAAAAVPLHRQVDIAEDDVDEALVRHFESKAAEGSVAYCERLRPGEEGTKKPEEDVSADINSGILKKLQLSGKGSEVGKSKDEVEDLEEWLDDFLDEK